MNAILENIRVALNGLLSNKLRAALTTLGISIGVAAVIVLVSLGQAVQDFVAQQFLGIGTNLAFVLPGSQSVGRPGGSGIPASGRSSLTFSSITERDFTALADPLAVPDARYVAPLLRINRDIVFNGNKARGRIHGTTPDFFPARTRRLVLGRYFDAEEMTSQARVAVIGLTNVRALFPDTISPINETIRIDNVPFRVIGVLEKYGGTSFNDEDDVIAIPLSTAYARLSSNRNSAGLRPLSVIYLSSVSEQTMDSMVEQATEVLRKTHDIKFRQEDDFQILTQKDLLESFGQITALLTIFLGVIAGISLLVGGIGIMNIMLVTVTERTREIGLRKAVGARNGDIMLQFVIEAITLAMVGGLVGLGVATGGTLLIRALVPTLDAVVRPESVLLAIGISSGIGVFFGLYPASRAAALNPIEALRYE
jgi:putative ABC transport system permease protein